MRELRRPRDHGPEKVARMIEASLAELGLDPGECRNDEGPEDNAHLAWSFRIESGHEIFLILGVVEGGMTLEVRSLIAKIPHDNVLPFYRRLLEINSEELTLAALGISGQYVTLSADRPTTDLDAGEITDMISRVVSYVERYAGDLRSEFSCPEWNDE